MVLEPLLGRWGFGLPDAMVVDPASGPVEGDPAGVNPIVFQFGDHPATRGLGASAMVFLRRARPVLPERKPEPEPWTTARAGDQLAERNGIRTYEASSAELKFEDNTLLTLTERSLVFLRGTKTAPKQTRGTNEIEIVDGHADLDKPAPSAKSTPFQGPFSPSATLTALPSGPMRTRRGVVQTSP